MNLRAFIPFEEDGFTGRTFYRNAGLSSREGIEAGFSAELMPALSASVVETINGSSGAKGYGFCGGTKTINVRTSSLYRTFRTRMYAKG